MLDAINLRLKTPPFLWWIPHPIFKREKQYSRELMVPLLLFFSFHNKTSFSNTQLRQRKCLRKYLKKRKKREQRERTCNQIIYCQFSSLFMKQMKKKQKNFILKVKCSGNVFQYGQRATTPPPILPVCFFFFIKSNFLFLN